MNWGFFPAAACATVSLVLSGLPLRVSSHGVPAPPSNERPAVAARQCLLVEDNPVFGEQMMQALGIPQGAWRVHWCRAGREALQWVNRLKGSREGGLDLALVDLGLPDVSGVEVVRAIHLRSPRTPVMVASVISTEESVLESIRAGARGYVLKADTVAHVTRAIEQVLQGEYPISPRLARALFKIAGAPAEERDPYQAFTLSPRETEALRLIARGLSYKEVATQMGVTLSTVQTYIRNLYRKLDTHSQVQAVNKAKAHGLI